MASLLRVLNLVATAFTAAMTIVMLLTFRKPRPVGKMTPLWSAGLSLSMLFVFALLSGARLNLVLGAPVFALGLAVGFVRGLATRLQVEDGRVMRRNSLLFLLGWGGSLALAQLLAMLDSAALASLGLVPLALTTGTQVGIEGNIFLRRLTMKAPASGPDDRPGPDVGAPRGLPERPERG